MPLPIEEAKARRRAGMERAEKAMTFAAKVHRALINGRPPASELRTPLAGVTAARVLHREIENRMKIEGFTPSLKDVFVCVAYVTPDLSALGHSVPFAPGDEAAMAQAITGNISIGLVFGIVDPEFGVDGPEENEESRILMGSRPFLVTKQTDTWLSELLPVLRFEVSTPDPERA